MTAGVDELEQRVVEYVTEHKGTTFVELERLLEDDIPIEGSLWLGTPEYNVWFWPGLSEEFFRTIATVLNDERVHLRDTTPLVYIVDGKVPDLELVKQMPAEGYVSERWLPVAFYPGPDPEEDALKWELESLAAETCGGEDDA